MYNYSIDMHVHSTLKPWAARYPQQPADLWTPLNNKCRGLSDEILDAAEKTTLRASQSALSQAAEGRVKILGISLMTYERGWVAIAREMRKVVSCFTGLSFEKLNDIESGKVNIETDLCNEMAFLVNEVSRTHTDTSGTAWNFKFITKADMQRFDNNPSLLDTEDTIYILLNIEGIQSLGIPSVLKDDTDFPMPDLQAHNLMHYIRDLKATWPVLPAYLTFCHHFGNRLAGHARTLPWQLKGAGIKQNRYMGRGISSRGFDVIDTLLNKTDGRILVDVKHFSAQSRKEYYKHLRDNHSGRVPILCSHTGFNNEHESLRQLMADADKGNDLKKCWLHNWSINMCREDVEEIYQSGGLIGVQTDMKRLIGRHYKEVFQNAKKADLPAFSAEVVWANIFCAMSWIEAKDGWDLFAVGSDYDGIVSYLPGFATLAEYPSLKSQMVHSLQNFTFNHIHYVSANGRALTQARVQQLMYGYAAEQLVDKIFSTNALAFWARQLGEKP